MRILDVSRQTMDRWVKDGTLVPLGRLLRRANGALLFDRAEVEKLRDERAATAAS